MTNTNGSTQAVEAEVTIHPKVCASCHQTKIKEVDYYKNAGTQDGYNKSCIPCVREYLRARRKEAHKEVVKRVDKGKYAENVGRIASMLIAHGVEYTKAVAVGKQIADEIIYPRQK